MKTRIEGNVEQPSLPRGNDLRHTGERLGDSAVLRHVAKRAGLLGDQHLSVGQKRETPGTIEPLGDCVSTLMVPASVGTVRMSGRLGCDRNIRAAVTGTSKSQYHPRKGWRLVGGVVLVGSMWSR